eukprot:141077_1
MALAVEKDISCICDDYCDASDNYGNYRELSDSNTKHQIMASTDNTTNQPLTNEAENRLKAHDKHYLGPDDHSKRVIRRPDRLFAPLTNRMFCGCVTKVNLGSDDHSNCMIHRPERKCKIKARGIDDTADSDEAKAMYSIEYLDNQYILTHENDMDAPLRIYETLLTKPMEQITIPKNTIDIEVWKETIHLRGFVDNGASITACGKLIFESFQKYEDNTVRNSVTAGGFDAEKTGQFWNATKRLKLPICHKRFDMILGRDVIDKRHLQIWYFECIPPELCIVGRDAIRLLDLALFSRNDIKRTIYYHKRDKLVGIVPEHEDIDAYLDKIEIKSKGKPGLYKIDENQRVHKLQVKFAKKGDMENALQHPNDSVCQLRVFDREPQHEKVLVHSQNIAAIELNVMQNGDVFSNNYILHTLDESQIAKEGTNAMLIRDLDTAVLTHVEVDGIKYPQCLDEVQFSEIYSKEEVLNCKASLSHMAKCLARSKFDIGKLTKYPPLSVHIKDDSSLRCGGYYPLNATDQTIVNNEIEDWIDHGLCVRMDQSNPKHVVRHTSSLFAVHRMMGVNKEDNSMIVQSRAVSDFKILNSLTEDYIFDNLTIQELMDKCSGATLSNCADIRSWFYHIPLHEDSIPVCALRVKGGIILPSRVIHGLKNAPIYGHELVSKIYQSCALAIQDDLTTPIFEANIDIAKVMAVDKIKELFRISLDHNISLNGKKIKVGFPITNRISRTVSATKTMLMTKHTTTALETKWDKMINKTDLLSFISMLQYIAPHIPHLLLDVVEFKKETLKDVSLPASVEKSKMPLRDKNKKLILNKTQYGKQLFDQIQDRVRNALILSQPDMRLQSKHAFLIIVDTSLDQTGAALAQQKLDEEPFVLRGSAKRKEFYEQIRTRYNLVELYSRSLHDVETRYSATEREMLGIKLAFRKFKRFLILKQFDLVTDCAPLVAIFKLNKDTNNAKLIRWRNETSYYTFRGHHLEGSLMVLVDYLSRGAIPTDPLKPLASPPKLELCGIVQYMVKYGVPTDTHKLTNAQAEINAIHGLFAVAKQQTKKKDMIKIEKTSLVRLQELNIIKTIDTASTKRLNYDAPKAIQTILSMNKVRANPQYDEWADFYTMDAIFSVLHRRARQYHDTVLMVDIPPVQKSKKFDAILNEMKCEMNPVMTRAQRKALTAQELNPQTTEITNDQDTLSHGMRMPDVALKDGLYEGIKPHVKMRSLNEDFARYARYENGTIRMDLEVNKIEHHDQKLKELQQFATTQSIQTQIAVTAVCDDNNYETALVSRNEIVIIRDDYSLNDDGNTDHYVANYKVITECTPHEKKSDSNCSNVVPEHEHSNAAQKEVQMNLLLEESSLCGKVQSPINIITLTLPCDATKYLDPHSSCYESVSKRLPGTEEQVYTTSATAPDLKTENELNVIALGQIQIDKLYYLFQELKGKLMKEKSVIRPAECSDRKGDEDEDIVRDTLRIALSSYQSTFKSIKMASNRTKIVHHEKIQLMNNAMMATTDDSRYEVFELERSIPPYLLGTSRLVWTFGSVVIIASIICLVFLYRKGREKWFMFEDGEYKEDLDIIEMERVMHLRGMMSYGSFLGDGSEGGADYTADVLHEMAVGMTRFYK